MIRGVHGVGITKHRGGLLVSCYPSAFRKKKTIAYGGFQHKLKSEGMGREVRLKDMV